MVILYAYKLSRPVYIYTHNTAIYLVIYRM